MDIHLHCNQRLETVQEIQSIVHETDETDFSFGQLFRPNLDDI
jgi:hypothetical protein